MKLSSKMMLIAIISTFTLNCSSPKQQNFKAKEVYKTKDLIITQIAPNSFQHISYLQTDDFGNVPCNGLIVKDGNEVVVFDTPTNNKSAKELVKWVKETLKSKINAVVPTHFHNDCLAGLKAFDDNNVPSYAYFKTIELAKNNDVAVPKNSFTDSLVLKVGNEKAIVKFLGEGHTKDNVVAYFPSDQILFGGCLVKEINATKGFLGDANVAAWPATIKNVTKAYPSIKIVVPGHGTYGDKNLLDYTIKLFETNNN